MVKNNKIKLVYVLAASHSGSTLTTMLINSHPQICTVGELKATSLGDVERYRCSCLEFIKQCPFWNAISQKMKEKGFDYEVTNARNDIRSDAGTLQKRLLNPLHRGKFLEWVRDFLLSITPSWKRHVNSFHVRNTALLECIADYADVDTIVDSSKVGIRLKYLLKNSNIEVFVVRVVRDGRGVALTYMNPAEFADARDKKLREGGSGGDRAHQQLDMAAAALMWKRSNQEGDAIISQLQKNRYIQIRYEDICNHTDETLKKIFTFAGVDAELKRDDYRSVDHHIVGNGMRLDSTNVISLDERWREVLTLNDLEVFDRIAGDLNASFGYKK